MLTWTRKHLLLRYQQLELNSVFHAHEHKPLTSFINHWSVMALGPTQVGIFANCKSSTWHRVGFRYLISVVHDQSLACICSWRLCSSVESLFNITDIQFHPCNPAVSSSCTSGFWVGEAYCVGISSWISNTFVAARINWSKVWDVVARHSEHLWLAWKRGNGPSTKREIKHW